MAKKLEEEKTKETVVTTFTEKWQDSKEAKTVNLQLFSDKSCCGIFRGQVHKYHFAMCSFDK